MPVRTDDGHPVSPQTAARIYRHGQAGGVDRRDHRQVDDKGWGTVVKAAHDGFPEVWRVRIIDRPPGGNDRQPPQRSGDYGSEHRAAR